MAKTRSSIKLKLIQIPFLGSHFFLPRIIKREGGQQESLTIRRLYQEKYAVFVDLYSYGGCFSEDFNVGGSVRIGRYCSFAKNIHYYGANHPLKQISTSPYFYNKAFGFQVNDVKRSSLVIENDVWIGANVIITCNCRKIGNGAVVGAGSIVTKDIPSYAIAVGNPARVIGYRFLPEEIEALEKSEWWKDPPETLIQYYGNINSPMEFVQSIHDKD